MVRGTEWVDRTGFGMEGRAGLVAVVMGSRWADDLVAGVGSEWVDMDGNTARDGSLQNKVAM